jgi:hypothetical protein
MSFGGKGKDGMNEPLVPDYYIEKKGVGSAVFPADHVKVGSSRVP